MKANLFSTLALLLFSPSPMAITDSEVQSYVEPTITVTVKEINKETNLYEFTIFNNTDCYVVNDSIYSEKFESVFPYEYFQSQKIRYPLIKPKETCVVQNSFYFSEYSQKLTDKDFRAQGFIPRNNLISITGPFNVSESVSISQSTSYNCVTIDCEINYLHDLQFEGSYLQYHVDCAVSLTYEENEYCFYGFVNNVNNNVELHLMDGAEIDPKKITINSIDSFAVGHPIEYMAEPKRGFRLPTWLNITIITASALSAALFVGALVITIVKKQKKA